MPKALKPRPRKSKKKTYWFRPKRFWKHFAAFYPSSWEGWLVSLALVGLIYEILRSVRLRTTDWQEASIIAAPAILILLIIWDMLMIQTGEYPKWWKKNALKHYGS
jgi:hypothetical protein